MTYALSWIYDVPPTNSVAVDSTQTAKSSQAEAPQEQLIESLHQEVEE